MREEHPIQRKNPSGKLVWVARYTTRIGKRVSGGTFEKRGPCRAPQDDGRCCAQHRIMVCYEQDRIAPRVEAGEPLTVEAYALRKWLQLHPRSARSDAVYTGRLRVALAVDCGDGPLGQMLFADVEYHHAVRLVDMLLREHGRAARGAKAIVMTMSSMWQDARRDGWARTANPFHDHRIRQADPRVTKPAREPRVLSWEQMHAVCAAAGPREAMLRLMSDCGLRLGEVLPVHREDVKLAQRCDEPDCAAVGPHVHVRRKAWQAREYAGTKYSERGRVAPVPPALEALLRALPPRIDSPLLFPAPNGGLWWEPDFRRSVWNLAVARAGLEGVVPHDFRHGWVSYIRAAAGVDIADAAKAAGHTTETATRTYTHALSRSYDAMRKAVGE
jgi:integrase